MDQSENFEASIFARLALSNSSALCMFRDDGGHGDYVGQNANDRWPHLHTISRVDWIDIVIAIERGHPKSLVAVRHNHCHPFSFQITQHNISHAMNDGNGCSLTCRCRDSEH